jgi:transcriptional regulator with XRE-family HTH domain
VSNVGDLGRRVAQRRQALGLSLDELAVKAGMDSSYLAGLEASASPQLSRSALWRLAAALETTVDVITGGGLEAPPGRVERDGRPALADLDLATCQRLIGAGGIGRVVFSEPRGPVALPVNFAMLDDAVIFRTAPMKGLTTAIDEGQLVSFEVDHLDEALGEGWSVLVSGRGHLIADPTELERARSLGVRPWAGGEREVYIGVVPEQTTGRRIRRA